MHPIDEAVHIVPYSSQWQVDFSREKMRLENALADPTLAFEHIGSTAIPEMRAKPIIDMMIGVRNYPPPLEWIKNLCSLGYSYYGEAGVPGRLYFIRRGEKNCNLAVVLFNGTHWSQNIKLRDFLREHPEECRAYEKIKFEAINSGADHLLSYSEYKKDFFNHIFEKINQQSH
jgi:GrpB-like predicted nucleotidyltransferase (UPF0157 family)